jgi:serine/threonine-protein kinase HipA
MSTHRLVAWVGPNQMGTLTYHDDSGLFGFDYSVEWFQSTKAFPLSPALPLRRAEQITAELHSVSIRRFFENLLPEGKPLDDAVAAHRLTKTNLYGLLLALGRESTGAIALLPEGETPGSERDERREISYEELSVRIQNRIHEPFTVWDGQVRLSIAGYQDKLAVYRENGRLFLVDGQLASTHILKPEPLSPNLPQLVANEHFCLLLASRLGVITTKVEILRIPEPVLVVERFDREHLGRHVERRHIVDACQALDLAVSHKYERNFGSGRDVAHIRDGVSLERLFSISEHAQSSAATRLGLLRWALLQYLIGNCDAHGKNISFFVEPGGLRLAPAYDLVAVCIYPKLNHELAMAFGDEFNIVNIRAYDWAEFADCCDLDRRMVMREMIRMTKALRRALPALLDWQGYEEDERKMVSAIADFTLSQAKQLESAAAMLSSIELD